MAEKLVDNFTQKFALCFLSNNSNSTEQQIIRCKKEFSLVQKLIVLRNAGLDKERLRQKLGQLQHLVRFSTSSSPDKEEEEEEDGGRTRLDPRD
jgi:hypothetical protein